MEHFIMIVPSLFFFVLLFFIVVIVVGFCFCNKDHRVAELMITA